MTVSKAYSHISQLHKNHAKSDAILENLHLLKLDVYLDCQVLCSFLYFWPGHGRNILLGMNYKSTKRGITHFFAVKPL